MPVLATLSYDPSPTFAVTRAYLWGFAVGWWDDTALITAGNPSVYQEVPFGGYRFHLKFQDWVYDWGNRSASLDELFEDLYASAPGDPTPISAGNVLIQYKVNELWNIPVITISLETPDGFYWLQRFPAAPSDYWCKFADEAPETPFSYP
jgi:hypothetical protein